MKEKKLSTLISEGRFCGTDFWVEVKKLGLRTGITVGPGPGPGPGPTPVPVHPPDRADRADRVLATHYVTCMFAL
jgi:hypothetical protein